MLELRIYGEKELNRDPQRYISGQQFAGEYQERGEIIVMHNL
jgi:hypothetical protein